VRNPSDERRVAGAFWSGRKVFALGCASRCLAKPRLGRTDTRRGGVEALGFCLEDLPGAVGGAVVDYYDFVRDAAEVQLEVEVLDGRRNAAFLVAGGNDDGQQLEWRVAGHGWRVRVEEKLKVKRLKDEETKRRGRGVSVLRWDGGAAGSRKGGKAETGEPEASWVGDWATGSFRCSVRGGNARRGTKRPRDEALKDDRTKRPRDGAKRRQREVKPRRN